MLYRFVFGEFKGNLGLVIGIVGGMFVVLFVVGVGVVVVVLMM